MNADDRAAEAEQQAWRSRELVEEAITRRPMVPALATATFASAVAPAIVRRFVQSYIIEPAIGRMTDIAFGVLTFPVFSPDGATHYHPASAGEQIRALAKLIDIGVPTTLGLTDGDGNALPGVIALGDLELDHARREVHGERYIGELTLKDVAPSPSDPQLYTVPPGHELVTQDEGLDTHLHVSDDVAPAAPPAAEPPALEQAILARHRKRKRKR